MYNCIISKVFAYGMFVYTLASLYYIIFTRNIGTPFNDSLSEEQRNIKKKAVTQRKNIFFQGCGLAIIIIIIFRPFKDCD